MDPLIHIVSGAAASQCFKESFPKKAFVGLCMLAAAIPDVDVLVGSDPVLNLSYRRGITHSLWLVPFWGVLFASLTRRFLKYSWSRAFLLFSGLVGLHLYLDLPNSYGTQILSPFSAERFAYDSVFIIDLFWLALFALAFFAGRKWGPAVAKKLFVAALLYPLLNLGIRLGLEHHLQSQNKDVGRQVKVSSDAFSPFRWKVFEVTPEQLTLRPWSLTEGLGEPLGSFTRTSPDFFSSRYSQHLLFRVYEWFAVYPVIAKIEEESGQKRYTVQDLRFYSTLGFIRQRMKNAPFEFQFTESEEKVHSWQFFTGGPEPQSWNAKTSPNSDRPRKEKH